MPQPAVVWSGSNTYSQVAGQTNNVATIPPGIYGTQPMLVYGYPYVPLANPLIPAQYLNYPVQRTLTLTFTNGSTIPLSFSQDPNFAVAVPSYAAGAIFVPGNDMDQGGTISLRSTNVVSPDHPSGTSRNYGAFGACLVTWDSPTVPNALVGGNASPAVPPGSVSGPAVTFNLSTPFVAYFTDEPVPITVANRTQVTSATPFVVMVNTRPVGGVFIAELYQELGFGIWINSFPVNGFFNATVVLSNAGPATTSFGFAGPNASKITGASISAHFTTPGIFPVSGGSSIGWAFFPATRGARGGHSFAQVVG